jgi:hypothetical protein
MESLAPVVLFVFKRVDTLRRTVDSLKQNQLAPSTDLIIYSDAARPGKDETGVSEVRSFLKTISGFKTIRIVEANSNKGLASSIIEGVSATVKEYGKAIVLEDDLLTSVNFLDYMNAALSFYQSKDKVLAISGFSMPIKCADNSDVYFTLRSSSWGWATWQDKWEAVDWNVQDYTAFKNNQEMRSKFNQMGSDMAGMLDNQMENKIDSWAIRWSYHQFKTNCFSVHPVVSKVENIGFEEGATHTKNRFGRFKTEIDRSGKTSFTFPEEPFLDKAVISQFVKPYSISTRIKHKLLHLLPF